jgi:hypothetical protein
MAIYNQNKCNVTVLVIGHLKMAIYGDRVALSTEL